MATSFLEESEEGCEGNTFDEVRSEVPHAADDVRSEVPHAAVAQLNLTPKQLFDDNVKLKSEVSILIHDNARLTSEMNIMRRKLHKMKRKYKKTKKLLSDKQEAEKLEAQVSEKFDGKSEENISEKEGHEAANEECKDVTDFIMAISDFYQDAANVADDQNEEIVAEKSEVAEVDEKVEGQISEKVVEKEGHEVANEESSAHLCKSIVPYVDNSNTPIAMAVRRRTELDDRKRVQKFTLSGKKKKQRKMNTNEQEFPSFKLLDWTPEVKVDEDREEKEEESEKKEGYRPLDTKKCVLEQDNKILKKIVTLHKSSLGDAEFCYYKTTTISLYLEDLMPFFEHKYLADKVVDAWMLLLEDMQDNLISESEQLEAGKVYFIPTQFWRILVYKMGRRARVFKLLETKMRDAIERQKRFVMFPVVSAGEGVTKKRGDHWTLLVLDLHLGNWNFYNSRRPRSKNVDRYFVDAKLMIEQFNLMIVENMMDCDQLNKLPSSKDNVFAVHDSPQQAETSVDCGFFVLYIMACYVSYDKIKEKLTVKELTVFKAKVLSELMSSKFATRPVETAEDMLADEDVIRDVLERCEGHMTQVSKHVETVQDILRDIELNNLKFDSEEWRD